MHEWRIFPCSRANTQCNVNSLDFDSINDILARLLQFSISHEIDKIHMYLKISWSESITTTIRTEKKQINYISANVNHVFCKETVELFGTILFLFCTVSCSPFATWKWQCAMMTNATKGDLVNTPNEIHKCAIKTNIQKPK